MLFEIDEISEILAPLTDKLREKFDGYALKVESVLARQVRFAVNKISVTKTWDETTLNFLVEKSKKTFIFSLKYSSREKIPQALDAALKIIEKMPPRENYAPLPEPAKEYPSISKIFDKTLIEHPEKIVGLAEQIIETGVSEGAKRIAGTVRADIIHEVLLTSAGVEKSMKKSRIYADVRAFCDKDATGHASMAAANLSSINGELIASLAASDAKRSMNAKRLEPGVYKTLFTIDAAASLLNLIGDAASAFNVDAGFSFFINKKGKKIAPENVSIIDNACLPDGYGSRQYDEEGVPTRDNYIIRNGVLEKFLHNRFTAKKFRDELTGNAGWIFPHAWEIEMSPGDILSDELLDVLGTGLVISNITYIRFQNHVIGDFSGIIRDGVFFVKNGEVKYAVKGLRLSDNMPRILANITGIGRERRQVFHWWLEHGIPVITPAFIVEKVRYTSATK